MKVKLFNIYNKNKIMSYQKKKKKKIKIYIINIDFITNYWLQGTKSKLNGGVLIRYPQQNTN